MVKSIVLNRESFTSSKILLLLKICCFCIFLGRAWQHLFWDIPIRAVLWDANIMKSFVEANLEMSWYEYGTSLEVDFWINTITHSFGVLYLLAAISVLICEKVKRIAIVLLLGSFSLLLLSFIYWKDDNFQFGQLIEHASQIVCPVLLYGVITGKISLEKTVFFAKTGIVLTFFGHGLYAIGYYRVPGYFMDMCINFFGFSESIAKQFLWLAGVADLVICITIFIPQLTRISLMYAIFWGLVTAMARVLANLNMDLFWYCMNQTWFEALFRFSHGLLPMIVLMLMRKKKEMPKVKSQVLFKLKLLDTIKL